MAAEKLEQNNVQVTRAASIIGQLEILGTTCKEDGNAIGDICCQIAITVMSVIITQNNPPKTWEPRGGYSDEQSSRRGMVHKTFDCD